jgi:uncharacterized protein involved in exopolysaccharide biosynthesis
MTKALSRRSLSDVIRRQDLYRRERDSKPLEDVVEGMRHDIRIIMLEKAAGVFTLSFTGKDPGQAQRTLRELTAGFTRSTQSVEIIDPPSLSRTPAGMRRPVVTTIGLPGGLLEGAVAAAWRRRVVA